MKSWLIATSFLFIFTQPINAAEITFFAGKKKVEIRKQGESGEGLFEDDRFIRFYPVVSREDLDVLIDDLEKYPIKDSELARVKASLQENFSNNLKPASSEDLIRTSLALGKLADEALAVSDDIECNEENGLKTKTPKKKVTEDKVYCECELPKGQRLGIVNSNKIRSFDGEYWDDYSLLGEIESSSLLINTSNDNHLHGLWRKIASPESDGNDRGRTFGLNLDYRLKGSVGEFRLGYESVIFTQLKETKPGSNSFYVNEDNAYLQDLVERNRLDASLRRDINDNGTFFIAGAELEQLTDDGSVAGPLQQAWHKTWQEAGNVQYDNQDHMNDEVNFTLYGGLGKSWMSDLGNWKCTSTIEGTIGHNLLNSGDTYAKARGEIELNSNTFLGGSKENPFLLVSMWAEGSVETEGGNQTAAGLNLSTPIQVGKWQVSPQVGYSIKNEKEDRLFTQSQSSKIEAESHIGITFTRKF